MFISELRKNILQPTFPLSKVTFPLGLFSKIIYYTQGKPFRRERLLNKYCEKAEIFQYKRKTMKSVLTFNGRQTLLQALLF